MTRADLGDWLGLVVETVSRALGDLRRQGLIAIERSDIVDPEGTAMRSVVKSGATRARNQSGTSFGGGATRE